MICSVCKKNDANVFVSATINGKTVEFSLCLKCAARQTELFGHLDAFEKVKKGVTLENVACPRCGTTIAKIMEAGRFGCMKCYELFAEQILPHEKSEEESPPPAPKDGKVSPPESKTDAGDDIVVLKKNLIKAIERENYELAAKIRDKINVVEKKKNRAAEQ